MVADGAGVSQHCGPYLDRRDENWAGAKGKREGCATDRIADDRVKDDTIGVSAEQRIRIRHAKGKFGQPGTVTQLIT